MWRSSYTHIYTIGKKEKHWRDDDDTDGVKTSEREAIQHLCIAYIDIIQAEVSPSLSNFFVLLAFCGIVLSLGEASPTNLPITLLSSL